ncbi:hypothetical protein AHAS_Ahas02G0103500 [Arachis hypogaea]
MLYIKMVLMDDKCDKIHYSIKSYLTKMFENELIEGMVYVFSNIVNEESREIYLPTAYVYRTIFKEESHIINTIDDCKIFDNHFNFFAHAYILKLNK